VGKKEFRAIGFAALGVVAGIVLFNNLSTVAGNTAIGKFLDGKLVRGA